MITPPLPLPLLLLPSLLLLLLLLLLRSPLRTRIGCSIGGWCDKA